MNFRRCLFLTFALFSFVFASCADMASDAASFGGLGTAVGAPNGGAAGGQVQTAPAAQKYVSVAGSVSASGAFPQEIAAVLQGRGQSSAGMTNGVSASAFPSMTESDLQYLKYKITAVKVGDESVCYGVAQSDIVISASGVTYGVNIPVLETPVTYKIKCEAYSDTDMTKLVLAGESESFTISRDSQTASVDVTVAAIQEDGATGGVDLTVENSTADGIDSATVTIGGVTIIGDITAASINFKSSDSDPVGIPCGAHSARFSFEKEGEEVYAFTQVVNVFKNLWTTSWVQNGAEPYFNTTVGADGKKATACALTAAMLESWTLTEFFVDASRSADPTKANYSTQSGTFVNPCLTFDGAVSKLVDPSKDYTIFINGTVKGAQTVPNTIQAKTLTICGANGLYTSGENAGQPKDTLKYQSQGLPNSNLTTLTVWTTVPVSIKNLKITGGYGREIDGNNTAGGILIGVSSSSLGNVAADVTLLDGTLVTGNEATFGGGVCLMNGSLKIKGAVISGNSGTNGGGVNISYGSSAIFYSGSIESNTVNDSGGGVCLGGSLEMHSEAVIKQNQAKDASSNWGGGVYVSNGASLTINGGEISANSGSDGGGVYNDGGSVAFNSGLIKSNSAAFYGGGVCNSSGSFDMKDGASITQNSTDDKGDGSLSSGGGVFVEGGSFAVSGGTISANTTNGKGGAVYVYDGTFSVAGSASIPYGEEKSNDVYLESGQAITVAGELTATVPVATITAQAWERGTTVAQADGTNVDDLTDYKTCFEFTNDLYLGKIPKDDKTILVLDAPIFVGPTVTDSTAEKGSKKNPYSSVKAALVKLTNKDVDYTICIDGEVVGKNNTIPNTLKSDGNGTYNAKSLTITGFTGNAQDILNGNLSRSGLEIKTTVPILLENFTIKNGKVEAQGAGINIYIDDSEKGGDITIGKDMIIENNDSQTSPGGGIALYDVGTNTTKLKITENAIIQNNTSCNTVNAGGGIYLSKAHLFISGSAKIINNKAGDDDHLTSPGGGIYCGATATDVGSVNIGYFDEGEIDPNCSLTISGNSAKGDGGGIYMKGGTLNIAGRTIQSNTAGGKGSAIYFGSSGSFNVTSRAYIYGGSSKEHDVCLASGKKITLGHIETTPGWNNAAAISLESYSDGAQVFEAAEGVTLKSEITWFGVNPETLGDGTKKDWFLRMNGKIYEKAGSKSAPSAVGDIVFEDGSAEAYSADLSLTNILKNKAKDVIVKIDGGSKIAVSKTRVTYKYWATNSANLDKVTGLVCTPGGSVGNYSFSGTTNGSNCLNVMKAFDSSYSSSKYPAFAAACNDSYYLPSIAELYWMWQNRDTVNNALQKIGTPTTNEVLWSCSQKSDLVYYAWYFDMGTGECGNEKKWLKECNVRAFRRY